MTMYKLIVIAVALVGAAYSTPSLQIVKVENDKLFFKVESDPGKRFHIMWTESLDEPYWTRFKSYNMATNQTEVTVFYDVPVESEMFFRIYIPRDQSDWRPNSGEEGPSGPGNPPPPPPPLP